MLLLFVGSFTLSYAQYSKEKLTDILTGGSTKSWTVKTAGKAEKGFVFNKNMTAQVKKGAAENVKWSISSTDNIRWFTTVGGETYETIVSYDKSGKQYVKFTHKDATPGGNYELLLYPGE